MALTIGQQGILNKEVLTIVSFNEKMFTCDNGKSYMIAYSQWMTKGKTVNTKIKKASKKNFKFDSDAYEASINQPVNIQEFDEMQQKSRMNQRSSSLR